MIKIVLDAFGGDNAPVEIVKGAVIAVTNNPELGVILTGKEPRIKEILAELKYTGNQIEIRHADDVITNDDSPTMAIRTKTNSSLVVAFNELTSNKEAVGLISAGSTGAVLTGGFMKVGRIKGVSRPAICPVIYKANGEKAFIMDCGANMDCKPINLVHFAIMADAYLKTMYKIEKPRIALLNVGVEDHKGNELVKEVFPLLKTLEGINFIGNMEARELLSGEYDAVIADGFSGNVLLKSMEGSLKSMVGLLNKHIKSSFFAKIGYLFMRKAVFKKLRHDLDYHRVGGGLFVGCKKPIMKMHGDVKARTVVIALNEVAEMHKAGVCKAIEKEVAQYKLDLSE